MKERHELLREATQRLRECGYVSPPLNISLRLNPIEGHWHDKEEGKRFIPNSVTFVIPRSNPLMQVDLFPNEDGGLTVRATNCSLYTSCRVLYNLDRTPDNPEQAQELEKMLRFSLISNP